MRGKQAPKRKILPDPRYNSTVVAKFINYIMKRGKKFTAQSIFYQALDIIEKKTGQNSIEVFDNAIKNASPLIEVRGRRIGGANYQIPMPVRGERKMSLAFRWILEAVRHKKGRPTSEKLADELINASKNEGDAIKKRNDVHRMAEANRAFAHFAQFAK